MQKIEISVRASLDTPLQDNFEKMFNGVKKSLFIVLELCWFSSSWLENCNASSRAHLGDYGPIFWLFKGRNTKYL